MAMIDLNRVLNQSLSSARSNLGARRSKSGGGLNLRRALVGLLAAVFIVCPLIIRAQELSATLSGVVTDSTGAVIPKATVSVTQTATKAVRTVQSDDTGNYAFSNVPAGTYTLSASSAGFTSFVAKDVILKVGEARGLNVQLKAGAASTTVTVEATAVAVDTESAAQAGNLSSEQIEGLELAGRNFQQLVTLQPGVVTQMGDETSAGNTAMSVNGARTTANNWTIDGADINDSGSNGTVINAPNVDAIQEFTLQRGNYDAGYGRSGGGQVLVATKSGGSAFHGDAYEFVRNTAFDSNEWFNKRTEAENNEPNKNPINHHNVYGFTIGGPVFIPKTYNTDKKKTFFFYSEEWRKLSTPGGDSMPAASQAELSGVVAGDFTNAPAGCATYNAISDTTQISPSCYSKNSQVYLTNVFAKFPANNSSGNYSFSDSTQNNFRDDIVRVDHYFNDKVHFYARGINDDMPVDNPEGLWAGSNYPGLVNTLVNSPGKNIVGNLTWTINPSVVNEFEFVWSQGTYFSSINSGQFATSSSINSSLTNQWSPDPYGKVPAVSIIGVTGFNAGSAPWKERNLDRTYFDNLSFNFGKHAFRTGFEIQQMIKTENAVNGEPSFSFNSWGDFLVGNVASFTQTLPDIIPDLHFINTEAYFQDDWKVTKRFTLNLGVRWSRLPSVTDVRNTLSNFDPKYYSAQLAPQIDPSSGNFVAGQYINGWQLIPATYTNGMIFPKGPECAAAQAVAPMSSCSPFGAYVNPNYNTDFAPRVGFAYDVFGAGKTVVRGGFGIFYDRLLDGIWEQNAFANPPFAKRVTIVNAPFDNITSGSTSVPLGPNGLTATGNPTFKVPNYANYNLSIQHQLLPSTVLEVAYVGNEARHLLGEYDENQPTVGARLGVNSNPSLGPDTSVNYIRPFAGYAGIVSRAPFFSNNYNSLQVSLNHHSHGLQVGLAYTFSKDLTTNSSDRSNMATDSYDFSIDYGLSSYNQPQTFTADYVYDLPFFKGQHGFEGKALGGWQVSGITSFFSGQSFSLSQPHDPWDPNGLNVGLGIGSPRPDQIAPVQKTKTVGAWFSTSSFAPALYHFGSEANGSLLGPGYNDWDLAAIKNITFLERYNFQLRGEFFNAFNHESFSGVDSSLADSSFGQVTSGHSPRRIQLGAKFNF
ncbi:carboxypeptidase regulatory-like domain-containing protein [Telmatobacter sp. DSM 110680]|uniref:Carboxypeptidase regulatory-like domain-containing protein n=1 Tax=Telmatobacter sp. DSM 110680 TaxID=3036704 RepID=A0AAU7DIY6_9BACT